MFRFFRLGAILAYLFAGIIVGPFGLKLVTEAKLVFAFSELGVVFLLFLIGLELAPARLWKLRGTIFGLGLMQVLLTGTLFMFIGTLVGLSWSIAFISGFGLALSSTAFSMQILEENRQVNTMHGQGSFSILMLQDLAVIPLLATLSILVGQESTSFSGLAIVKAVGAVLFLVVFGRYFLRYVLRYIAESRITEVFIASALLIVIGSAILMESVGFTMGMGAFLAGVLLANSEYRHELESSLSPFKGLLLGLFFIAVGMSLNLDVLILKPHWIVLIALGFMICKSIIIYSLGRAFGFPYESSRNMAFTLPQGGEFAFVLFGAAATNGLMSEEMNSILSASVTLSMAMSPFAFKFNQKWIRSYSEISERPYDKFESEKAKVIIAGYGRFGQIISRFLKSQSISHTILEHSAKQIDAARRYGSKIYYGDASRVDILEMAGAPEAEVFVLAIGNPQSSIETAKIIREKFPHLKIVARARNRQHVIELMELGVKIIHRETLLTSLEAAKEVMMLFGHAKSDINSKLARFRQKDEAILAKQYELRHNEKEMIQFTIQANKELEQILQADEEKTI